MQIKYLKGDATSHDPNEFHIIVHCVNDVGGWGAGFVLALSEKFEQAEKAYRRWAAGLAPDNIPTIKTGPLYLGEVQFVKVAEKVIVANLCGQKNVRKVHGLSPVRYGAIHEGLLHIREFMRKRPAVKTIVAPRFGCGLAGGDWNEIEKIINEVFQDEDIEFVVYDFS